MAPSAGHTPNTPALTAVSILFIVLCPLVVSLRFRARQVKKVPFGIDDYFCLLCLVLVLGLCGFQLNNIYYGYRGIPPAYLAPPERRQFFQRLFADTIFTGIVIGIVKVPVVLLYLRIFPVKMMKIPAYGVLVVVGLWILGSTLTAVLARKPVSAWWNGLVPPRFNFAASQVAWAAIDIAIDVFTLCLPLPILYRLQIKTSRKLTIIAVLWLGVFCVAAAGVRLYYFTLLMTRGGIWSLIEPCCTLIAGCLPTLTPLFRSGLSPQSLMNSIRSVFGSGQGSAASLVERQGSASTGSGTQYALKSSQKWTTTSPNIKPAGPAKSATIV